MKVEQLMTKSHARCSASELVSRVAARMKAFDVRALPVADRSGQIVGIVTEDDLTEMEATCGSEPSVSSVMTRVSETCEPSDSIDSLAKPGMPRRFPVAEGGNLVGLLVLERL